MKKAVDLLVKVTRRQAINFAGKTLRSVHVNDDMLVVHRKMHRGRFAICYYPLSRVIAYQEGEGGKEGTAYATVIDEVVMKTVQGKGIVEAETGLIKIVTDDGLAHYMNMGADEYSSFSIVEVDAEALEEPTPIKRRPARPVAVEEPEEVEEEAEPEAEEEEEEEVPVRRPRSTREVERPRRSSGRPKSGEVNRADDDWGKSNTEEEEEEEDAPPRRRRRDF